MPVKSPRVRLRTRAAVMGEGWGAANASLIDLTQFPGTCEALRRAALEAHERGEIVHSGEMNDRLVHLLPALALLDGVGQLLRDNRPYIAGEFPLEIFRCAPAALERSVAEAHRLIDRHGPQAVDGLIEAIRQGICGRPAVLSDVLDSESDSIELIALNLRVVANGVLWGGEVPWTVADWRRHLS